MTRSSCRRFVCRQASTVKSNQAFWRGQTILESNVVSRGSIEVKRGGIIAGLYASQSYRDARFRAGPERLKDLGGHYWHVNEKSSRFLLLAGSAAILGLSASSSSAVSNCEEKAQESKVVLPVEGEQAQPEIPVYENLPEHDVETDCFLCRTHRQGPCRPQWRNFEYCAKDHPNDEGAEQCAIYVQSFQECWMKHLNLYLLIAMTLNHERVEEFEKKFTQPDQLSDDLQIQIDWHEWEKLIDQEGFLESCQQVKSVFDEFDDSTPIWKVYESLKEEPFVVNVVCHVPTRRQDGRILRVAYGLDQENRTIGLADHNEQYEIEKAESEGRQPNLEYYRVVLSLIPGLTEAVKIRAIYVEDENFEPEEEEGVATEDLDYVDEKTRAVGKKDILASSDWIPLPGLVQSLDPTVA